MYSRIDGEDDAAVDFDATYKKNAKLKRNELLLYKERWCTIAGRITN